ncbi:MAG: succinate dehydrogenase, hydrophobic membrane anchor protein [Nitrospirota bacterium]
MLGWLLQRVTGVLLVAGLAVHFFVMHYSGAGQIGYEAVVQRLSNPCWKAFDMLFLVAAVYHGFNGLWGMAIEYVRSAGLLKLLQVALLVTSTLLIAAGIYILTS